MLVWIVSIGWVVLLLPRFNGPQSDSEDHVHKKIVGSVLTIIGFLFALAWLYKSGIEEPFLLDNFGTEYDRYRRQVKRLIPMVW